MTLRELFELCSAVCDKHINKNPNAGIQTNDGAIFYTDLKAEIEKVKDWCYPNMDTDRLKLVVRCQECSYYQPCTQVAPHSQPQVTMRCNLTGEMTPKNHYCSYAREKE